MPRLKLSSVCVPASAPVLDLSSNRCGSGVDANTRARRADGLDDIVKRCVRALVGVVMLLAAGAGVAQTAHPTVDLETTYTGPEAAFGIAVDAAKNVYVSSWAGRAVFKGTLANGVYNDITLFSYGSAGVFEPSQLAVDAQGNLYIANGHGSNLLKATYTNGSYTTSTIATTADSFLFGVALDAAGDVFYTTTTSVYEMPLSNGSYQAPILLANGSSLNFGISLDAAGNIYYVDTNGTTLYKLTKSGNTYTKAALVITGAPLAGPEGIVPDAAGNLYVTQNFLANQILKLTPTGGVNYTSTVIGTQQSEGFDTLDANGVLYTAGSAGYINTVLLGGAASFPTTAVGTAATQLPVYFTIDNSGTLGATQVLTQGAPNLDFTMGTGSTCTGAVTAGTTCFVNVAFTPQFPGQRMGAVELTNSSGAVIATTLISGIGTGPQVTYSPGTISTVAGNGTNGYVPSQDTGTTAATSAELNFARGVALDGAGNLYIADQFNHRIREVTAATGTISTVAGTGTAGYNGDNQAATSAELNYPYDVVVDGAGNLYISDDSNNLIRKVTAATGVISTVAGNGTRGYSGDGQAATSAELSSPVGLALDGAGDLYFADGGNNLIRKVTAATGIISTVAGNGTRGYNGDGEAATSSELNGPLGLAVDAAGDLYFTENYGRVRKVTAATGLISTVAGDGTFGNTGDGGPATSAKFEYPQGIAVDAASNVYISEAYESHVRKVTAATGILTKVAGGGTAACAGSTDSVGDGCAATNAPLSGSEGLLIDPAGNLYIAGDSNIRKVTATAAPLSFASTAAGSTSTDSPQTVTMNNIGNSVLTFASPVTGSNPSLSTGFSIGNGSTCPQLTGGSSAGTLAVGASCTDLISFAPTVGGSIGGQLVTTDDSLNVSLSAQTVTLSGTATYPTPAVNALSPTSGSAAGGNTVTIIGTGLSQAMAVNFGAVAATSFTMVSDTSITAVAPAEPAGAVFVTVSSPGGTSSTSVQYTFASVPVVSGLSPNGGTTVGGDTVTINGTNFLGTTSVSFGGVAAASFTVNSATSIAAVTPAGTGVVDVIVTTAGGPSVITSADKFTYYAPQSYVVTTLVDDVSGVAANCATGNSSPCSLRDAIAAANAAPSGAPINITFAPATYAGASAASPAVYSVAAYGTLGINGPESSTVTGPVDGSGNNLLALDGGYNHTTNSGGFGVLRMAGNITLSHLIIQNGYGVAGGIYFDGGVLTIANDTFSGNLGEYIGAGGIYLGGGTATVINSTFSNNSGAGSGGIYAYGGPFTISNSTFSGNSGTGGAIYFSESTATVTNSTFYGNNGVGGGMYVSDGTVTLSGSTFSGNSGNAGDIYIGGKVNLYNSIVLDSIGGTLNSSSNNITSGANLSALGSFGGPTQTMVPLPGSKAICAGAASIPGVTVPTTDQRGATHSSAYCAAGQIDVGAVQTSYGLGFTTQPSDVALGAAMSPAPVVSLTENGLPTSAGALVIGLTDADGVLSSSPAAKASPASFGNLIFNTLETGDSLTATASLSIVNGSASTALTATSSAFNVYAPPTVTGISPNTGPSAGGTVVTISGSNFVSGVTVSFGGTPATSVSVVSATQILATAPAGSGKVDLTVARSNSVSAINAPADQFTYFTPLSQVIQFAPTTPDVAGDSVVLSATGGGSGNAVVFSVLSGPATLANDGVTLTYTGSGTVVVAADQAGNSNYTAADEVTATIIVNPAVAAHNAGTVPVASQSSVLTATLNFPNGGTLGSLSYLTQGAPNLDFIGCVTGAASKQPAKGKGPTPRQTVFSCPSSKSKGGATIPVCSVGTMYSAGQICTVSYIFQPSYPGRRLGAVAAVDTNGNPMGTSFLTGLGTGPLMTFPGSTAISTVGSGFNFPYGVAVDGSGNVFVSDYNSSAVYEIVAVNGVVSSSSTVNQVGGSFNSPGGVAVDGSGDVFVAAIHNNAVYEIVAVNGSVNSSSLVKTLGSFDTPHFLAVDGAGDVYVAASSAVNEIVAVNGSVSSSSPVNTVASGFSTNGLAVDGSGNVFVSDSADRAVYEIVAVNGSVSSSSTVNLVRGGFNTPEGVAVDASGDVFVNDSGRDRLYEIVAVNGVVTSNSTMITVGGVARDGTGVAVDGSGHVFVAEVGYGVKEIDLTTAPAQTFADTNVGSTSSDSPATVTVANSGYDPTSINPLTFSGVSTGTTSFALDASNACSTSTSLEPGQTCSLAVDFTPQTSGSPLTDVVALTDNNLNNISSTSSPQTVPLSGNGLQKAPSVTTVICPASVPYTGAAQSPCTASVKGLNLNQPLSVSYIANVHAGVNTASATATFAGDANHTGSSNTTTFTITQATPVVTWANPPSIVYGTGTGPAQKTATATGVGGVSLLGSYFYTTPDGTVFGVGTHPLGVAFTPTDSTDYASVSAFATLTVTKATPTVTWTTPAAITYGTALSGVQLNATASVAGTFVYTPAAGTVLHAGAQTLSVTFTPNDTTDYGPVTTSVLLTVNKATPVITWPTPAAITYGTPLSATQLNATANVAGTFAYTASTGPNPLGVLLPPGTTALSATLTPTDSVDYNPVTAYVVFTVSKAQTTTTLAVSTTQTVTGTTATLTATVKPQIGGVPTGTVTYYNGSAVLGSSAVGVPFTTGVLPVGTDAITAVYGGDANFVGSSSSASAVVSVVPTTVQLTSPLSRVLYPASAVSFTVIVPLKNLQLISGTVTLYDGATVIGTYSLPAGGILVGITPRLSVGMHTLRAVYGGNGQYPPGQSPVVTVTALTY